MTLGSASKYPSRPVHLTHPSGGFGDLPVVPMVPRIQIDAVYGALGTDVQAISTLGGSAIAEDGLFKVSTGTNSGAYGVIRSRRLIRYLPGSASRYRFTAAFTSPVANSYQWAGAFTAVDAVCFGYVGTQFGAILRQPGAIEIHELDLSAGAAGNETVTITLDGNSFAFPVTIGSAAEVAYQIATQTTSPFTGWRAFPAQSYGTKIHFYADVAAAKPGAFSISSTGTVDGTWSKIQEGAANVVSEVSGSFIPQSEWNIDKLDGSGAAQGNPSGILADWTKLNVFEIDQPYLGAGTITFRVMLRDGSWADVHRIEAPNSRTTPTLRNPTVRLGWLASSLGSTTNLQVTGASAAAFVEGSPAKDLRDSFARMADFSATTDNHVRLAIRSRGEFGSTFNQREVRPLQLVAGLETTQRLGVVSLVLNPTITGVIQWGRHDDDSSVDYATPNAAWSGGRLLAAVPVGTGTAGYLNLDALGIRLEPGDVLAVVCSTVSNTSNANITLAWAED